MKRKVVVTGLGVISPLGNTTAETWSNLLHGKSGIQAISLFNTEGSPVTIAGEVKGFNPALFFPQKDIKKVGRFIQLAMAASREAYADSGLETCRDSIPSSRFGINIGVGMGGLPEIEDTFENFLEKGYRRVSPFFIPQVISNLAAGQVAIALNLQGPSFCSVSACASSAHSIGESARTIERGEADLMLVGGAEAVICRLGISGFAAMRALSTRNDQPTQASRPFDSDRDGFIMSEGAAILVLEEKEHALKRGAKIYAELAGYGSSTDAYHITTPSPEGTGAKNAMRFALKDAELTPADIDYINAHATSTATGDYEEAKSIAEIFAENKTKLHISSTKSSTGHLLGAAGALEAVFSVLSIQSGIVPATQNLDHLDPKCAELGLNFTPHTPVEKTVNVTLSNSFGFGGANACLIFKKFKEGVLC